jgi:hypothetical protein
VSFHRRVCSAASFCVCFVFSLLVHSQPSRRYARRPRMLSPGVYDYTEILPEAKRNQIECSVKLAFYLLSFFYFLYRYASRTLEPALYGNATPWHVLCTSHSCWAA